MKSLLPLPLLVIGLLLAGLALPASAAEYGTKKHCPGSCFRYQGAWHGAYYHSAWGMPVALVVPPTAEYQTHWGWGVGNYRVTPICPQFQRNYPGDLYYNRRMFGPTPPWPSDSDQFGVYYVRGPW